MGPVCAALGFPSTTYYAAKRREAGPPDRRLRDQELKVEVMAIWDQPGPGNRIYGARKIWLELNAAGVAVARCTVERLMRELGIAGVGTRAKKPRTTVGSDPVDRPSDLLERDFGAAAPSAGSRTSPMCRPRPAGATPRSSWIFIHAGSSGRLSRITCAPDSPSMPWRWESGGGETA